MIPNKNKNIRILIRSMELLFYIIIQDVVTIVPTILLYISDCGLAKNSQSNWLVTLLASDQKVQFFAIFGKILLV